MDSTHFNIAGWEADLPFIMTYSKGGISNKINVLIREKGGDKMTMMKGMAQD